MRRFESGPRELFHVTPNGHPPGIPRHQIDRVSKISEETCQPIVDWVVGRLDEPVPDARGMGIVMVAGGPLYLAEAYVNVSLIREMGCRLPVQIWYLGPHEMNDTWRAKFDHLGVEFVDAKEFSRKTYVRTLTGWTCKALAVKYSPFRYVMLLDADCHPQRNPEEMLTDWEFHRCGMIVWPDCQRNARHDRIFPCLGLKVNSVQEHENGLFMLDKVRNWKVACLMKWVGDQADFFYKMRHGEKDYWGLCAARLGVPFSEGPKPRWKEFGALEHYWPNSDQVSHHHYIPRKRMRECPVPQRHRELFGEFTLGTSAPVLQTAVH